MKEPLLRYIACHRKDAARAILTAMRAYPDHFRKIPFGPLKGCVRRTIGDLRSVYKPIKMANGRSFVLQFSIVIRPGWPESLNERDQGAGLLVRTLRTDGWYLRVPTFISPGVNIDAVHRNPRWDGGQGSAGA